MNKSEFIEAVASKSGSTVTAATAAVNAMTEVITETLAKKEKVQITGFGSFEVSERAARPGRNPQTGETIQIKASTAAKFSPGQALKDALNK